MTILNQSADKQPVSTNPKNKYVDVSALMKPQQLNDLTLPKIIIDDLKRRIAANSIENMLFLGKPGTGKTAAANLIMSELTEWKQKSFDGRNGLGPVTFREHIAPYARGSLTGSPLRICFIDNVNHVSKEVRSKLFPLIWNTRNTCRFILAANSKARDLIRSDIRTVWFNVREPRDIDVQAHVAFQYERRLSEAGIHFDRNSLIEIISCYFPNLQEIADAAQNEFIGVNRKSNGSFRELLQLN
jgi:DNA polymerase III delta prime subunit